jgi:hypothetical protein
MNSHLPGEGKQAEQIFSGSDTRQMNCQFFATLCLQNRIACSEEALQNDDGGTETTSKTPFRRRHAVV